MGDEPIALAGSLVLIGAAGVVALLVIRGVWHFETPAPVVASPEPAPPVSTTTAAPVAHPPPGPWITPTKPVTVTQVPPPKTVTAQAPPPPVQFTAYDQQFLQSLQGKWGWRIDEPEIMIENAYLVCVKLQQGQDLP